MTTILKPGMRLQSRACETELVVVRAPVEPAALECGGAPVVALGVEHERWSLDPAHSRGTAIGKRYADQVLGLELLCTKGGQGSLAIAGAPLPSKDAKPLPSSD
jgi:hypothetical protein